MAENVGPRRIDSQSGATIFDPNMNVKPLRRSSPRPLGHNRHPMSLRGTLSTFLVLLLATSASGGSLGDAARREKERREHNKETGVVAREARPGEIGQHREDEDAAVKAGDPAPAIPPDGQSATASPADGESYWRARAANARARAQAAQINYDKAASKTPYLDTPSFILETQRNAAAAEAKRKSAKAALDAAQAAVDGLEDEARRAGVPPGWVR